jgi:hypothetical protein
MKLGVLNEVVQKKMVADVWKFIAACYHITQRYTVHTKQLITHKQSNRTGKISFPSSPVHPYRLLAQTASYKNGHLLFSVKVYVSWRMKLKKLSSGILESLSFP